MVEKNDVEVNMSDNCDTACDTIIKEKNKIPGENYKCKIYNNHVEKITTNNYYQNTTHNTTNHYYHHTTTNQAGLR